MAQYVDASSLYVANTCFNGQSSISSVDLKNTAWQNNSMVNAFRDCGNLTSISNISNTVTDMSGAFAGSGISSVTIPDGVTDLGSPHTVVTNLYGYDLESSSWISNSYNVYLDTPNITNSSRVIAQQIGTNMFNAATFEYMTFQNINANSFKINTYVATRNSNKDLTNITVSNLTIGAFSACQNLTNGLILPDSVSNGSHLYQNCVNLKKCEYIPNCNSLDYTFYNCQNLSAVTNVPNTVTSMNYTFYNCISLLTPPSIPNSVIKMHYAFSNCQNLVSFPDIPSSVINMVSTFENCVSVTETSNVSEGTRDLHSVYENCYNLVKCRPLPESAIYTRYVYFRCNKLTELPPIPRNSTMQFGMYRECTNVITAPIIPQKVTDVGQCFTRCTNLTGDIIILSNKIQDAQDFVFETNLTKNVYIPFTYDNGVNTATYNAFINAGYTTTGSVNGVYLKDIDTYMSTHNFTYTTSGTNVTLTNYTGSSNTVTIPYTFKGE